jgi:P-type Ca2+ transporter type 2C
MSAGRAAALDAEEVVARVSSNTQRGLTSQDAAARLVADGANTLAEDEEEPWWRKVLEQFEDTSLRLLLASAVVSALLGRWDDAISIAAAIALVTAVATVQELHSDAAVASLRRLAPAKCRVLRDGHAQEVLSEEVVVGDVVLLGLGDRVPADVRLVECMDLSVNESSLTGEAEPHEKRAAASAAGEEVGEVAERHCVAHMGSLVCTGRAKGVVVATGANTELGKVAALVSGAKDKRSPLQQRMDDLADTLTKVSLVLIAAIVVVGVLQGRSLLPLFQVGVSLSVAAIPEGLPIVVAVTLALGVQRMAAQKAIVKRLPAVEALGCTTIVCADKTGTLTRNEMTAVALATFADAPTAVHFFATIHDRALRVPTPADAVRDLWEGGWEGGRGGVN